MTRRPEAGPGGAWWDARAYAERSGLQTGEGRRLVATLAPRPGSRVLDLGCGDGRLTVELARFGAHVVGLDSSAEMARAAAARGVDVVHASGQRIPFGACAFDLVFSNAAIHWIADHERLIAELARVLRRGGRLAARLGGVGNQWAVTAAALRLLDEDPYRRYRTRPASTPWTMGDPLLWSTALERSGFLVHDLDLAWQPAGWRGPADMRRWFAAIAGPFTAELPPALRPRFVAEVVRRAWPRVDPDRAFVRLVVDAERRGGGPAPPS